jgi:Glycosyl transferases group 1
MIFDPHDRGHYLTYIRYILTEACIAERVTLVLQEDITSSEAYRTQLSPYVRDVEIDSAITPGSFRRGSALLADFQRAVRRHKPDHVWIPSGDLLVRQCNLTHLFRNCSFARGMEAECGMVEIRFHHSSPRLRGQMRQLLERTLLRHGPWQRLHTIDPTAFGWMRTRDQRLARRFALIPDPVEDFTPVTKQHARRELGIPTDGTYIGTVGSHAIPRKGTNLLLDAFARAKLGSHDRLLIAGPLGEKLHNRLRSEFSQLCRADRVILLDRYLTDVELMMAISAMDVVCTPYFDHLGSSGIVLRAAQLERCVLAPDQGWFAYMIPRFGLGETGHILESTALARSLETALVRSREFQISPACRRLIRYSHPSNFARLWAVRLRQRMGLPELNELHTWQWVLQAMGSEQ